MMEGLRHAKSVMNCDLLQLRMWESRADFFVLLCDAFMGEPVFNYLEDILECAKEADAEDFGYFQVGLDAASEYVNAEEEDDSALAEDKAREGFIQVRDTLFQHFDKFFSLYGFTALEVVSRER
eukprot:Trichotokara_eunicae@DN130_c0_g1_i2.p1